MAPQSSWPSRCLMWLGCFSTDMVPLAPVMRTQCDRVAAPRLRARARRAVLHLAHGTLRVVNHWHSTRTRTLRPPPCIRPHRHCRWKPCPTHWSSRTAPRLRHITCASGPVHARMPAGSVNQRIEADGAVAAAQRVTGRNRLHSGAGSRQHRANRRRIHRHVKSRGRRASVMISAVDPRQNERA